MAALLETISANKARPAHRDCDGSAQAALRHGEPTHMSWFETMRGCRGMGPLLKKLKLPDYYSQPAPSLLTTAPGVGITPTPS